jgi:hypothetical protein
MRFLPSVDGNAKSTTAIGHGRHRVPGIAPAAQARAGLALFLAAQERFLEAKSRIQY